MSERDDGRVLNQAARSRRAGVALVSAVLGLLLYASGQWSFMNSLELRASDQLFKMRQALWGPEPIDSRLLLIGIDEKTFDSIRLPSLFWQPYYLEVFQKLRENGASVVALDLIFAPDTRRLEGPVLDQLQAEEMALAEVVSKGPFLLIELLMEDGTTRGPTEVLAALASRPDYAPGSNLTVANVIEDEDGSCRRLAAYVDSDGRIRSLYSRTLELALESQFESRQGKLFLNKEEIPTEQGLALRLNYPAAPLAGQMSAFPTVSMADVLSGKVSRQKIENKICIVAPAADILQDFISTPYQAQALGVEAHLSAINTVLTGRFLTIPPIWPLLLSLLSVTAALIGQNLKPRQALIAIVLCQVIYFKLAFLLFSLNGLLLPLVSAFLAFLLGGSVGYLDRLATIEHDRALIRSIFGRMVSPQVMEHVLDSPDLLLQGQEKEVTVLFTDINNFTPICEKHTPAEVVEMLSDYFELMTRVILKNDGYIKQYVGDEIMVIFGAPKEQADHARRAVLTGIEILKTLEEAENKATGPGFFDTKVGINTGPVVVGKVGSEERWEYAAVGDDVNLGARVMSLTKKLDTKMLISEKTRRVVGDMPGHQWVSRGLQSFKGKEQELELFEIETQSE